MRTPRDRFRIAGVNEPNTRGPLIVLDLDPMPDDIEASYLQEAWEQEVAEHGPPGFSFTVSKGYAFLGNVPNDDLQAAVPVINAVLDRYAAQRSNEDYARAAAQETARAQLAAEDRRRDTLLESARNMDLDLRRPPADRDQSGNRSSS